MSKVTSLFVAAPLSPLTVQAVGKAFAKAQDKLGKANTTYMAEALAAAQLINCPITAGQYDRQVAPSVRAAFKASRSALTRDSASSAMSRLKTFTLAVCTAQPDFQPVAGETFRAFLDRIAEPLTKATLPPLKEGDAPRPVWDTAKQGKPAKAPGSRPGGKSGTALPGAVASAATVGDGEGGLNARPIAAAAMIVCGQNAARAQRLCIVMQSYASEFDKWTSTILTDDDKAELAKLSPALAEASTRPNVKASEPAQTAMAAALIEGQRKANSKAAKKATVAA